jgi:hypothetical protein
VAFGGIPGDRGFVEIAVDAVIIICPAVSAPALLSLQEVLVPVLRRCRKNFKCWLSDLVVLVAFRALPLINTASRAANAAEYCIIAVSVPRPLKPRKLARMRRMNGIASLANDTLSSSTHPAN